MSNSDYKSDSYKPEINTDLNEQMTELLEHNHEMLKDAQEGQWDKVIEAEVLRNTMMKSFYTTEGITQIPGIDNATSEMLSISKQLEQLANDAKQTAACEAQSINKGRNAISAYVQHES